MWQNGRPELPSEYKRRHRAGGGDLEKASSEEDESEETETEEVRPAKDVQSRSWLSRIFSRR